MHQVQVHASVRIQFNNLSQLITKPLIVIPELITTKTITLILQVTAVNELEYTVTFLIETKFGNW